MTVTQSDQAPAFKLPHKPGEEIDLAEHIGKRPIVLLFFPLAFSPVCTDEMCHMRDSWDQWTDLDAAVFGISVDSPFVTHKFRQEQNIPFPILSDFNKEVAKQYDALHDDLFGMKGVAKRAAIVIGTDGTITYRWVTDNPKDQPPYDEVRKAVAG